MRPLLDARQAGAYQEVANIMPGARALVATFHQQVDEPTRQHVLAYFQPLE